MKHWPFSIIQNSPLTPPQFAWELHRFPQTLAMSNAAAEACAVVAQDTRPMESPNLELVLSADAPPSLIFLGRPEPIEWRILEPQGVVFHAENYFLFSLTWQ